METTELVRNLVERANVADCLRRSATLFGSKTALIDANEQVSYQTLHEDVNDIARGLQELGVGRGDFVALLFKNCVDFFRVYLACARLGAVALPLNWQLTRADFSHLFGETNPKVLVAQPDFGELAAELAGDHGCANTVVADLRVPGDTDVEVFVGDRDPLQCIYTSGTTGPPKGVITSHLASIFTSLSIAHHMRLQSDDTGLVILPAHHVAGLNDSVLPHITVGATVVLHEGWDAGRVAAALQDDQITDTLLTAPMWIELLHLNRQKQYDWSRMRTCLFGLAALPDDVADELRSLCPQASFLLAAGQSEFTGYEVAHRPDHQFTKPDAWGDPTLMTDVGVMDDSGRLLGPHETGEIVYRGPQAMTGYFRHPELTEDSFQFGWFHSGDLGFLDGDHTLYFVDRKKDVIKTGGENVSSVEVSNVLLGHPAVADCAVVGLPHPRWTEAITAFVGLAPGAEVSPAELRDYCGEHLAPFKVPKEFVILTEFPRTAIGKIQKVVLRQTYSTLYTESR